MGIVSPLRTARRVGLAHIIDSDIEDLGVRSYRTDNFPLAVGPSFVIASNSNKEETEYTLLLMLSADDVCLRARRGAFMELGFWVRQKDLGLPLFGKRIRSFGTTDHNGTEQVFSIDLHYSLF